MAYILSAIAGNLRELHVNMADDEICGVGAGGDVPSDDIEFDATGGRVADDDYAYKLPLTTVASRCAMPASPVTANYITVFQSSVQLDLLGVVTLLSVGNAQGAQAALRTINTDGGNYGLELLDEDGNQLLVSSGVTFTADAFSKVTLVFDRGVTLGGDVTWVAVVVDDVEWFSGNVGAFTDQWTSAMVFAWGEYQAGGVSRATDIWLDNPNVRRSTTIGDAPWTAVYPKVILLTGWPDSDETEEWAQVGGSAGDQWTAWDDSEIPQHDGDTSRLETASAPTQATSYMDNPADAGLGVGGTILHTVMGWVHKDAGGGKAWNARSLFNATTPGQTTAVVDNPAGTYEWDIWDIGDANVPARADTVYAGFFTTGSHSSVWRVTLLGACYVCKEATIATNVWTPPPSAAARRIFIC